MPILIALTVIIQACFVVHALKTGRPTYWVFIIMAAPVLGCVAYYFVEVFPSTRESAHAERAVNRAIRDIGKSIDPTRELRARAQDVETCGSVDNRLALARECIAAGLGEEAVKLVQSCLGGPFAADPQIKLLLVESALQRAIFNSGSKQSNICARSTHIQAGRSAVVEGALHESADEVEPALSTYAEALPLGSGEEVRVRYAQLLLRNGRVDMGRELLEATLKNAERFGSGYRGLHRDWVAAAKRDLGALRA